MGERLDWQSYQMRQEEERRQRLEESYEQSLFSRCYGGLFRESAPTTDETMWS